jgi:hypothetical protein
MRDGHSYSCMMTGRSSSKFVPGDQYVSESFSTKTVLIVSSWCTIIGTEYFGKRPRSTSAAILISNRAHDFPTERRGLLRGHFVSGKFDKRATYGYYLLAVFIMEAHDTP